LSDSKNDTDKLCRTYVSFIDVLFAVVIGQSFVLLTATDYYSAWFAEPLKNAFGLSTLVLVYALVVTSWVGYHQSVENYPLKSVGRFLIDIVLLFLYYYAFANAKFFGSVLFAITASFFAYTIWDSIRIYENRNNLINDLWKRMFVSLVFFGLYLTTFVGYGYAVAYVGQGIEWLFFAIAVFLLIAYRCVKWYKKTKVSSHDS
jgi:succinate dehydrogenase hydrophobic anchor subunit